MRVRVEVIAGACSENGAGELPTRTCTVRDLFWNAVAVLRAEHSDSVAAASQPRLTFDKVRIHPSSRTRLTVRCDLAFSDGVECFSSSIFRVPEQWPAHDITACHDPMKRCTCVRGS